MFHYVNNIVNERGDGLASYRVKLKVPGGAYTPLYSDEAGTPIVGTSGIANTAVTNEDGLVDFWCDEEIYDLEIYDAAGNFVRRFDKLGFIQRGVGTATNNSGMTTTLPAGATLPAAKTAHLIKGGGGAAGADKGLVVQMTSGTLSALDIKGAGTGKNARFFRPDGLLESYISDGNAWITAKWIGIYAGIYTDQATIGAANYDRVYHPPHLIPHMFGIHADVDLAMVIRGSNVADPKAVQFMKHDGYGYRLDMCDGTIRWPRADLRPFVGDRNSTTPAAVSNLATFSTDYPIALEPFNAGGLYGMQFRSYNVGTIGEAWLGVRSNGGMCSATTGRTIVHYESAASVNLGNATDATVVKGAQIDFDGIPKLKSFTVATLPSAATHPRGRAFVTDANATTFASIVAGGGTNGVPIYSDGTNWRIG